MLCRTKSFLFIAIALAINIAVTKKAKKNETWSPYGAPDLIAGFSAVITIFIMVVWLAIFYGFGFGEYIY